MYTLSQTGVSNNSTVVPSTSTTDTYIPPTGPQTVTNLPGWNYLGCYTEATTGRALNGILLPIRAAVTDVESCAAACSGYVYFGVEYGQECYCGNVLNAGSVNSNTVTNANPCNMICADNANEYCGGRSVLNLYQLAATGSSSQSSASSTASTTPSIGLSPTYLGCWTEKPNIRTLLGTVFYSDLMTIEMCRQDCLGAGYLYAGVEYSREVCDMFLQRLILTNYASSC